MNNPRPRTQMHVTILLRTNDVPGEYFRNCARIRNVSITRLTQLLFNKITEDRLTEAVLDDGGQHQRTKNERRHVTHYHHVRRVML